jgi:hypothetical protein
MTPKTCPFCGATPEPFVAHLTKWISIQCMNDDCGVRPYTRYCDTVDDAIRAWNTRADDLPAPSGGAPEARKSRRQKTKPSPANLEGTR